MRKFFLEPEKPLETVEVKAAAPPTWKEYCLKWFGCSVEPRTVVRQEKRAVSRRWRWQTHAEVEDESGIIRHERFFDDDAYEG